MRTGRRSGARLGTGPVLPPPMLQQGLPVRRPASREVSPGDPGGGREIDSGPRAGRQLACHDSVEKQRQAFLQSAPARVGVL